MVMNMERKITVIKKIDENGEDGYYVTFSLGSSCD